MDRKTGKRQTAKGKRRIIKALVLPVFFLVLTLCPLPFALCQTNWPGVDESVVEKIAGQQGRKAGEPLINTDKGDLLLFFFLLAGAVGGFAAGYCWRMLVEKAKVTKDRP